MLIGILWNENIVGWYQIEGTNKHRFYHLRQVLSSYYNDKNVLLQKMAAQFFNANIVLLYLDYFLHCG